MVQISSIVIDKKEAEKLKHAIDQYHKKLLIDLKETEESCWILDNTISDCKLLCDHLDEIISGANSKLTVSASFKSLINAALMFFLMEPYRMVNKVQRIENKWKIKKAKELKEQRLKRRDLSKKAS